MVFHAIFSTMDVNRPPVQFSQRLGEHTDVMSEYLLIRCLLT